MEGEVVAEIMESRHPGYQQGELVQGRIGWRTHAAVAPEVVRRVETGGNAPTTALGILGMPGFTAYSGMKVIGQPKTGETVVVAAARPHRRCAGGRDCRRHRQMRLCP
jgi:NADPH-dependent curcumin reductase CurA